MITGIRKKVKLLVFFYFSEQQDPLWTFSRFSLDLFQEFYLMFVIQEGVKSDWVFSSAPSKHVKFFQIFEQMGQGIQEWTK